MGDLADYMISNHCERFLQVKELNPNIEFLVIGPILEYAKKINFGEVFLLPVNKLVLRFLLCYQLALLA